MNELRFSLRTVTNIVAYLSVISMMVCVFSCEKNEEKKVFSPPKWIQGEWEYYSFLLNIYEDKVNFKFTINDVIFTSSSYGNISYSFNDLYEEENYLLEETIKTDEIYEITVTLNNSKKICQFRKGDDKTHIEYWPIHSDVVYTLYKK